MKEKVTKTVPSLDKRLNLDLGRFTIIQIKNEWYRIQKKCSVTDELYVVEMSDHSSFNSEGGLVRGDFTKYYTKAGKHTSHLTSYSTNDLLFLQTTLTPGEIATLTPAQKNLSKKIWRSQIKKASND